MADAKEAARERVEQARDELVALSHRIHANPELGFEEEQACAWLCELLDGAGLQVERGVGDLPTAFAARAGSGPLHVVGVRRVRRPAGRRPRLRAQRDRGHGRRGRPGPGQGGRRRRAAGDRARHPGRGGRRGQDPAARAGRLRRRARGHDGPPLARTSSAEMPIIAVSHLDVAYTGKEAHASAYPYLGINAADALVVAQTAIGLLRQHLRPSDRVHGIVTKGGDAANIIPAHTDGRLDGPGRRPGAARGASGPRWPAASRPAPWPPGRPWSCPTDQRALLRDAPRPRAVGPVPAQRRGPRAAASSAAATAAPGSTDMGNVSLALPSIHPTIGIDSLPGGQPPARVHRQLRHPGRRPGGGRRRAWPWPGRRSTPPPTRPSASGCWPVPATALMSGTGRWLRRLW